jgi:hypothetical protein
VPKAKTPFGENGASLGKARDVAGARASMVGRAVVRKVQSHNVAQANILLGDAASVPRRLNPRFR